MSAPPRPPAPNAVLPWSATVTVTCTDRSHLNTDLHFSKEKKSIPVCLRAFVELPVEVTDMDKEFLQRSFLMNRELMCVLKDSSSKWEF